MKKLFYYLTLGVFLFSCSDDDTFQKEIDAVETESVETISDKIASRDDVNDIIFNALDEGRVFKWSDLDADDLWAVIEMSDYRVDVFWSMDDSSSKTENDIENIILTHEDSANDEADNLPIFNVDKELHFVSAVIQNKETIEALLNSGKVEIIEPFYTMITDEELAAQPANKPTHSESLSSKGKVWRLPGVPYNTPLSWSAIGTAADVTWERGLNGHGVGLAVIDMGVPEGHPLFADLPKTQKQYYRHPITKKKHHRTFYRRSTYSKSIFGWDWNNSKTFDDGFAYGSIANGDRDHGVFMLTTAAGAPTNDYAKPRADERAWGTGIAYGVSRLYSYRASDMVALIGAKRMAGVRNAFKHIAGEKDIKIISMSMGDPYMYNTGIANAIKLAYNKGKMIFTAAGTVPFAFLGGHYHGKSLVTLFPAYLNEVYGVTGIDHNNTWCFRCHGRAEFVLKFDERGITDFGKDLRSGSSSRSTATMAGIAALIWGTNPKMSRGQVYDIMRKLSQYPNKKHPYFGRGTIDLTGFYGAKKAIKKAKNMGFSGSSNNSLTLGNLDKNDNADVIFEKSGKGDKQKFKIIDLGTDSYGVNIVALKGANGKYIGVDAYGNLKASGRLMSNMHKFKMHTNNYGQVALEGGNGKFVNFKGISGFSSNGSIVANPALPGSIVRCNSDNADDFSWFKMN